MRCTEALLVLVGDARECDAASLREARLHVLRCPRCRQAYAADLGPETQSLFRRMSRDVPRACIVGLLIVALFQLVLAIPWVFGASLLPHEHVAASHLTRDGALGLVIAAAGLVTAWRPRYAYSMVVIGVVVLALQIVGGVVDERENLVSATFELAHLPVVVIVAGLFAVAAALTRRATPTYKPRRPLLRVFTGSRPEDSGMSHVE